MKAFLVFLGLFVSAQSSLGCLLDLEQAGPIRTLPGIDIVRPRGRAPEAGHRKTFPLAEIVEAHRYLESNQQVGKIVVTV